MIVEILYLLMYKNPIEITFILHIDFGLAIHLPINDYPHSPIRTC